MIHPGTIVRTAAFYFFSIFPIQNNKLYFSSFDGKGYGDNPKYICEELLHSNSQYDIIWEVENMLEPMPNGVRKVKRKTLRSLFEAATSKVWVDNYRKNIWFRKRKNQLYIQTWHAGIGLKKAENAAAKTLPELYINRAKKDSAMIDLFLSGSQWETEKYAKYYWYNGPILKTGVPKQDILIGINDEKKNNLKKNMGIAANTKIALYAPTFRKNMSDGSIYQLDWERLLDSLQKKFGGNWVGAIRIHSGLKMDFIDPAKDRIINLSKYPDAQEVLVISDILITDYSSIIFDYALTGNPAFLYATDLSEYRKDRDIFFDLSDLPFPFSDRMEVLIQNVTDFNKAKYDLSIQYFLREVCGMYPCGNASRLVSSTIEKYIKGEYPYYDIELDASN